MGQWRCQYIFILLFWVLVTCYKCNNETDTETSNRKGKALNISKRPCSDPSGRKGICTFKWDCISQNGTKIGTCMDGFITGTCCYQDTYQQHLFSDTVPDIMLNHHYISFGNQTEETQNITLFQSTSLQQTSTTKIHEIDIPSEPNSSTQSSLNLVTWTSISPSKQPQRAKPVQISIFPFSQGIMHNHMKRPGSITYPSKPYQPNNYILKYRPPYYSTYYTINNHKIPSKSGHNTTRNFTILIDAVNSSMDTFVSETTTVSMQIPFRTSTKTSSKIPIVKPINRLPLPSVSGPGFNYISVNFVPTTTLETHLNKNSSSLVTTTIKPPKKPVLDYRKDCGVRALSPRARIVGGASAHFGKWPWQILVKEAAWLGLYHKNKCGGVLISSKYAITAGHCQPGFLSSLIVLLGEYDLNADVEVLKPEMRRVKRMVVHRHYNPQNFDNDIAILELDPPVVFKPHISPICLPGKDEEFTGKMAYVTGWGKTRHGGSIPNLLQEVQVPIVSNTKCLSMFKAAGHIKIIKDNFLCAGYESGGKDSCEGDSGGPLMVKRDDGRWVLAGTVSHGIRCADPNLPGVYMKISAYRSWIDKIVAS